MVFVKHDAPTICLSNCFSVTEHEGRLVYKTWGHFKNSTLAPNAFQDEGTLGDDVLFS